MVGVENRREISRASASEDVRSPTSEFMYCMSYTHTMSECTNQEETDYTKVMTSPKLINWSSSFAYFL